MKKEMTKMIADELIKVRLRSRDDLDYFKRKLAKKYKLPCLKNSELLQVYHKLDQNEREKVKNLELLLRKRPVRSLSGIVNVSVLTKPWPCPGKCIFCPSQKDIPKSYLSGEPAVQRAVRNRFHPYKQVIMRLTALASTGHPVDKVELRIIGGTWSYYPRTYQKQFVAECFRACNNFGSRGWASVSLPRPILGKLQKINETAKSRTVGIAVETRPDYIDVEEIQWMRKLGITKVELGVQSIYDDVLKLNCRGHAVAATVRATKLLKNAGFKISYQMMPGLYGSNPKKDLAMFQEIFTNPDFKPDYLKIYPLALVKNTKLYKIYQQKKFKPYNKKQLTKLLIAIKKQIPYWCRVERIIRDIPPADIIEGGSNVLNLREIVAKEMEKRGLVCRCIRCREVKADYDSKEKLFLFREEYEASSDNPAFAKASAGKEIFLSFENKSRTKLFALLRLRLADRTIVRDVHTYGQMAQIGGPQGSANIQHKGLGKKLMARAEKIAKAAGYKKIAVISGIGVRGYYRKLGYKLQNTYMVKKL